MKLQLARDLTKLYINWYTRSSLDEITKNLIRDALIRVQDQLTTEEKELYTKWHKRYWPLLDW